MNRESLELETQRLILRRFNKNDLKAIFNIFSDKEVNTYLPWFVLKSMEEAKEFFEKNYLEVYKQCWNYKYAICLKSDNIPIGYVNVSMNDSHDFGYGLCKEFWNNGFVTEAGKAVIEQLKKDGFDFITATHDIKNPRSGNVMKKLGMQYKYSYEELWQPKNILVTFRMYQLNIDNNIRRVYKKYWNDSKVHFV